MSMGWVSAILGNGYEIQGQNCVATLQERVLWVWPRYRNFMLGIWCFRWIVSDTSKWLNGQQSRLLCRQSVILSREGRLFNFDIVNSLWKSNGGRGKRPNFVFWVVRSVLFVSRWVAMTWTKVLFRTRIEMWVGLRIKGGNRYGTWIASAKSQSVRGASHQPAFMGSYLAIGHMY